MIYSVSSIGEMMDFLKSFPFVSVEDYMWGYSSSMIRLMSADNTRVEHISEKKAERLKREKNGLHFGREQDAGMFDDLGRNIIF